MFGSQVICSAGGETWSRLQPSAHSDWPDVGSMWFPPLLETYLSVVSWAGYA